METCEGKVLRYYTYTKVTNPFGPFPPVFCIECLAIALEPKIKQAVRSSNDDANGKLCIIFKFRIFYILYANTNIYERLKDAEVNIKAHRQPLQTVFIQSPQVAANFSRRQ